MVYFKISRLKYYDGEKIEEYKPKVEITLCTGEEMCMNRSDDDATDICLISPIASRKHAIIVHRGDLTLEVKDLGTVNGTFINGKKIEENVWMPLKNDDVLSIGLESYTTKQDEEKYFYKVVEVNRRCKNILGDIKANPACDNSSNVNNTIVSPAKKSPVQKGAVEETPDSTMKTRSGNLYTNDSQESVTNDKIKKEDLKKRKPSSPEQSGQPPNKKASLDKESNQLEKKECKRKETVKDEKKLNTSLIKSHVVNEKNTKASSPMKSSKEFPKRKNEMEPNICTSEPKLRVNTKKKGIDKTINVELEVQNILSDKDNIKSTSPQCEPLHSTQELIKIMDSQNVTNNIPKRENSTDFDFKMPTCSKWKRQSSDSNVVGEIEYTISKLCGGARMEQTSDLECAPNSTQDLKNILTDSQSMEGNPNNDTIHLEEKETKKIFKKKTIKSPSKKPKFDYSFEKFYDIDQSTKKEKKKTSTSTKKSTPQKNTSKSKKYSKAQKNGKTHKEKSSKMRCEKSMDISDIVGEVEDSQEMSQSQYSMTEDEVVSIVYDDNDNTAATTNNIRPETENLPEDIEGDEDIGWLKELSQSYDDSCALIIHEEDEEAENQSSTSSFDFIKQDEHVICFDEEDNDRVEQDKPEEKSLQEVQDKIKNKHAGLRKTVDIIDAPVINPLSPRRSKRNSGTKKSTKTSTGRNSLETVPNKTGLSFYCRSVNESPKFMITSLKRESRNHSANIPKKSEVKKLSKPKARQVNFQSDAEQVHFDNEDTSSSVKHIERHMIKLNTNPSICKLQSMQSQSIRHTLSGMERNHSSMTGTTLGDNVHLLCWLCSWLPQQMTMELPPPIYKGMPIEKVPLVKQTYTNIAEFYEAAEPLLYYQVWSDMSLQYAKEFRRGARQISLVRNTVEYVPTRTIQSSRKKLFRIQCSIKNSISKWLQEKQILLITFNPVPTNTSPSFECFGYIIGIDKLSNNVSFDLHVTLNVVSEKELTFIPTSPEMNAQVMTRVDINQWKGLLMRGVNNPLTRIFLNPVAVVEPPLVRMRDLLQNVGTCTLGQKHVVSTFLDVCLENDRKLVLVDAHAGSGKTTAVLKAIENLLLYTTRPSPHHKILLFGSGVGSLDEISSQLINLRKSLPSQAQKKKIKFLRLDESQHAEVKTYTCNEFVQSDLRGFKKEALENPALIKRKQREIMNIISNEADKDSPYCRSLHKALQDLDSYQETKLLSKEFLLYFFKAQKRNLIDGADVVCCNLKELLNTESCNYINLNSHRKSTVCIIEDANLCTDLDLSLILQLHIDKLVLIGDSTVDVILPFTCLYRKNFHWNFFKRLIRAKRVSRMQMIPVIKLNHIHRGTSVLRRNIKAVFSHSCLDADPMMSNNMNIMDWCLIDHKLEGVTDSVNDKTVRVKACDQEAILVVNIATEVKNKYPHRSVVIITAFDTQRSVIMKTLSNKNEEISGIHVSNVVDFMGRQADVVIFSTKLPYALTSNVLEIVFTRARASLVIVGNFSTNVTRNSYTSVEWAKVLEISRSSRCLRTVGPNFDLRNEKQALRLISN